MQDIRPIQLYTNIGPGQIIKPQRFYKLTTMANDYQAVRDMLNSLHDRMPEGEFKAEVVTILQELNRIEGVTSEEEITDLSKTGIEVPKKKQPPKGL